MGNTEKLTFPFRHTAKYSREKDAASQESKEMWSFLDYFPTSARNKNNDRRGFEGQIFSVFCYLCRMCIC